MIRKPDLRIDTEFFDDNLNSFNIPEAIKVTQAIDTQTFIKEGLNEDGSEHLVLAAIESIEKIMTQKLFQGFVNCWNKLKHYSNEPFIQQINSTFSQKGHRRQSPIRQNNQLVEKNEQVRGIVRQKMLMHKLSESQIDWLQEQRRKIRKRSGLKSKINNKSQQTHFERAKVLKEIVDKLKYGKDHASTLNSEISTKQQDQQLHYKLSRLQRLMEDVHLSSMQRNYTVQPKKLVPVASLQNDSQLQMQLRNELCEIKKQMQTIRLENERILKEEEWKRSQISRMVQTKEQIRSDYQTLKRQIDYLERETRSNQQNRIKMHQQLSYNKSKKQEYEQHISILSQRVTEPQKSHSTLPRSIRQDIPIQYTQRQIVSYPNQGTINFDPKPMLPQYVNSRPRQIVPSQPNPFGYSTFGTPQKKSEYLVEPVGTHLGAGRLYEQGRQSADEWACC